MDICNDDTCLLCLDNDSNFTISMGAHNQLYCMICALESIRHTMRCPLTRNIINEIKVFSKINSSNNETKNDKSEILTIKSPNENENLKFQMVIDKILTIENLEDRNQIEKMYEIDPYLLWVGGFEKINGIIDRDMVEHHFNQFGSIQDILIIQITNIGVAKNILKANPNFIEFNERILVI